MLQKEYNARYKPRLSSDAQVTNTLYIAFVDSMLYLEIQMNDTRLSAKLQKHDLFCHLEYQSFKRDLKMKMLTRPILHFWCKHLT